MPGVHAEARRGPGPDLGPDPRAAPVARGGGGWRRGQGVRPCLRAPATAPCLWRYVAYLSADPQSADDLTQETFLRALSGLHRFEGRSSARTWLLSIARRTVVDSFRQAAARPRLCDRDDWQSLVERRQPRTPGFDDGVALAELLATVPAERRDAFVLTQMLGLPYADAAQALGCPIGTVRSRVARARATLVDLLREPQKRTRKTD
ncbi:sigma-70 family RNA polymerase sigma factor [Streptomyces sp. NPDC002476]|uniref:sigma-70 family RNA polymerase sigma factor n=1 Tax=Streptomyces sp. NPDC002476 TaxID=3364648 RepID=UPI0036B09424